MEITERVRVAQSRSVRDRSFVRLVREAYDGPCAMTGLKIENGGGWTEAQAAHIRPVQEGGPDSLRNALLLSSTMHALFDRGFLTIDPQWRILIARQGLPESLTKLLPTNRRLARCPSRKDLQPHETFLLWHQKYRFKG